MYSLVGCSTPGDSDSRPLLLAISTHLAVLPWFSRASLNASSSGTK